MENFRRFDDACQRALTTWDWPRIEDVVYMSPADQHHGLQFLLIHTLMEWLKQAGEERNPKLWPDLRSWFQSPDLKWEMEEQLDLIVLEAELLYPDGIPEEVIEGHYCDRFCGQVAGLDGRVLAARLGARNAALCPNEQIVLANHLLACRQCHVVHERFGDYLIGNALGKGGQGTVHVAYSFEMDHVVALKRLRKYDNETTSDWNRRSQFLLREGVKAKVVEHPNAVRAFDCGTVNNVPYIAYALVQGETLAVQLLPTNGKSSRFLSAKEAAAKIGSLANAVSVAHTCKVLHLDIKPANVLIDDQQKFFLTDFGLGNFCTHHYCAPEQIELPHKNVDERADIYSLGLLLYESTTGSRNEREGILDPAGRARLASLPRDFQAIVEKCLQPDPGGRYTSARDLSDDLARFVANFPVSVRPIRLLGRTLKWSQRQPWVAATLAVMFVSLVSATAASLFAVNVFQKNAKVIETANIELTEKTAVTLIGRANEAKYPDNIQYFADALRLLKDNPRTRFEPIASLFNRSHRQLESSLRNAGIISQVLVHPAEVAVARMHSDQPRVVTCSGNRAWLWDYSTGDEMFHLDHPAEVVDVFFAGTAGRLLTVTRGPDFRLWNGRQLVWHKPLRTLKRVGEPVFLSERRIIALCDTGDSVALLDMDLQDGQFRVTPCLPGQLKSSKLYPATDLSHIAFQTAGLIHVWNVQESPARLVQSFPLPAEATCVAFFHKNQAFVVGCDSRQLLAFRIDSNQTINLPKPFWPPLTLDFAPIACRLSENDTALIVDTGLGQRWFDPIYGTRHVLADREGQTWWPSFQYHLVQLNSLSTNGRWRLQSRGKLAIVRDLAAVQEEVSNVFQHHWQERMTIRADGAAVVAVSDTGFDGKMLNSTLSVRSIAGAADWSCCWLGNSEDVACITKDRQVQVIGPKQSGSSNEKSKSDPFRVAYLASDCTVDRIAAVVDRETIGLADRSLEWKTITVPHDQDGWNRGIHCASATSSLLVERRIGAGDNQSGRRIVKCLDQTGRELWIKGTADLPQKCCGFSGDGMQAWILNEPQKLIIRNLTSNSEITIPLPDPVRSLRLSNNRNYLVLASRLNPEAGSFSVAVVDLNSGHLVAPVFRLSSPLQPNLVTVSNDGQLLATVNPVYSEISLVATSSGEFTGESVGVKKQVRDLHFVNVDGRHAVLFSNATDSAVQLWKFDRGSSLSVDDALSLADLEVAAHRQTQGQSEWADAWQSLRKRLPESIHTSVRQHVAQLDANANACELAGDYTLACKLLGEANSLDSDSQPIRERKIRILFDRLYVSPEIPDDEFDALTRDIGNDVDVMAYQAQREVTKNKFDSAVELAHRVLEQLRKGQHSRHYTPAQWNRMVGAFYAQMGKNQTALEHFQVWWSAAEQLNQAGDATALSFYCSLLLIENKADEYERIRETLHKRGPDRVLAGEAGMILEAFLLSDFPAARLADYRRFTEALIANYHRWGKGDRPKDYYQRLLSVRINDPHRELVRTVFETELLAVAMGDQRKGDRMRATLRFAKARKLVNEQKPKFPTADAYQVQRWSLSRIWLNDATRKLQLATTQELLQQGIAYFNTRRLDEANEYFDAAIELDGASAEACYLRGLCKWMQGDYQAAFEDGWKAVADLECPFFRMEVAIAAGINLDAQGKHEPLIRLGSQFAHWIESGRVDQRQRGIIGQALVLIMRQDFAAADAALTEFLSQSEESVGGIRSGYRLRAAIRANLGHWQGVLTDLKQFEKLPGGPVEAFAIIPLLMTDHRSLQVQVLAETGDFKSAEEIIDTLVEESPQAVQYRIERALIRIELHEIEKAREDLHIIRQQWGPNSQIALLQAIGWAKLPDREEYRRFVSKMLAAHSTNPDPAVAMLAVESCLLAEVAEEDFDKLEKLTSVAIKGKPLTDYRDLDFDRTILVGKVLYRTRKYAEANELFKSASEKEPEQFAKLMKLFSAMSLYRVSPQDSRCRLWLEEAQTRQDDFQKSSETERTEMRALWPMTVAQSLVFAEAEKLINSN